MPGWRKLSHLEEILRPLRGKSVKAFSETIGDLA